MSGSGGGGIFSGRTPAQIQELVRQAEARTTTANFEAELARLLGNLLAEANARDTPLVRERLDDIRQALEQDIDGSLDQLFGGSVAKHTYVDGLSDIDSLLVINGTNLEQQAPSAILERLSNTLKNRLGTNAQVEHGRMAVTVTYPDGMQLQLLPAIRTDAGIKVPSSRRNGWSQINPETFREALTKRNDECGGKLVPTIKLAKAIIGTLPEAQRLSGYHIESLAIGAFKGYDGPKTTAAMLPRLFERAKELVLSPIKDSTGQSVHVDAHLGPAQSTGRMNASHLLGRLERRMRNATAAASLPQWQALFDDE